jgi:hypothetical protein
MDTVSVLACLSPLKLTKTWLADGTIRPSDEPGQFYLTEYRISSFAAWVRLLDWLESEPKRAIIRDRWAGAELPGKKEKVRRNKELFRREPHHWLMIDVDEFMPETADPVLEPEAAIEEFIQRCLPEEFHFRSYRWQLSSSAGHPTKSGLRAHLFFWLKTPYGSGALANWARVRKLPIDVGLFNKVQLHYTAGPAFEEGADDPVPVRSGVVEGFEDEVDLVIPEELVALVREDKVRAPGEPEKDPGEKPGVIGAFCRAYSIDRCLEEFGDILPFEFETPGDDRRLNFLDGGGAPGGAFITPNRCWIANTHNSDPFQNRAANAFDLMRHFKFGHLDDEDDAFDADPTSSTSYHRMVEWAKTLPDVQAELAARRAEQVEEEIEAVADAGDDVLAQLRAMTVEQTRDAWVELLLDVGPIAEDAALAHVSSVLSVGRRPLQQALRQAREARTREARRQSFERHLATRAQLPYQPDLTSVQASNVEELIVSNTTGLGNPHRFFYFGGLPSHVTIQQLPKSHCIEDSTQPAPAIPLIKRMSRATMRARAEQVVVFTQSTNGEGAPTVIGVPSPVLDGLMDMEEPTAPHASGLITHPVVLQSGRILSEPGLDAASGLLCWRSHIEGCRPYSREEALAAIGRIKDRFFHGFELATPLDEACALAALFSAVERRAVDQAPAFLITADVQGTGKTTLVRRMHAYLTGRDIPTVTYPRQEDEANKLLFSLLLASPAMVCFDNLRDGITFESPTLNQILTTPYFEQRLLGENRSARVPTDVLFVLTGNKIDLGRDELTRYIEVKLTSESARPDQRVFSAPDVLAVAQEERGDVLRDIVGIVAGFLATKAGPQVRTRFPLWDRLVRQSLLWVGCEDVAEAFDRNHTESDDTRFDANLMQALWNTFGQERFKVSDVMTETDPFSSDNDKLLQVFLDLFEHHKYAVQRRSLHSRGVGRILKLLSNKRIYNEGVQMRLVKYNIRGYPVYQILTEFDDL